MAKKLPGLTSKSLEDIRAEVAEPQPDSARKGRQAKKAASKPLSDRASATRKTSSSSKPSSAQLSTAKSSAAKSPTRKSPARNSAASAGSNARPEKVVRRSHAQSKADPPLPRTAKEPKQAVESPAGSPRLVRARQIVNSRRKQAIAAGLVPVPYVDVLIAGGIQLAMLRSLAELYEVPFHRTRARALCGALLGSLTPHMAAWGTVGALKLAPGVGLIVGSASMAVASGVFTSALGQLFIVHFETGGTLLTFDPSKMRDHFERELQAAQQSE